MLFIVLIRIIMFTLHIVFVGYGKTDFCISCIIDVSKANHTFFCQPNLVYKWYFLLYNVHR